MLLWVPALLVALCLSPLASCLHPPSYHDHLPAPAASFSVFLNHDSPTGPTSYNHIQHDEPHAAALRSFPRNPFLQTGFSNFGPPSPSGPPAPPAPVDPATLTCGLAPASCAKVPYRSLDGSCNNLRNPAWGVPQSPYARLLPAKYGDGVSSFAKSVSGRELPLPRILSLLLFPDQPIDDPIWNLNAMQWGQIVTHDMSLAAGATQSHRHATQCCTNEGQFVDQGALNQHCFPVVIPEDDPIHQLTRTRCMNFVRTITTRDRNCVGGFSPAEQLTAVTAYMDMSLVYGNNDMQHRPLRANVGGRLLVENRRGKDYPPTENNSTLVCESSQSPNEPCYLTGDVRVNQNPQLTILQIILLREHNRIADALAKINPHWNDETLFQETRKIAVAEYQHINYYEWLPIFLGLENSIKNGIIYPNAKGYVNDYDATVDPTVLNDHATAAFRFFHSLIAGQLQLIGESRQSKGAVRLSDWFNRPSIIEQGDNFDGLTRGLGTQPEKASDQFFDSEITQFLFKRNNTFGGDLRAIDIQRNRDHGLASYNDHRAACGLPRAHNFHDLTDVISRANVHLLSTLYESVDDIDLTVGGSLEALVQGTLAGPTFLCILTEQFYRTRKADRFFYENGNENAFTPGQLNEIRKASVSRLFCDNGDKISSMQPRGFERISEANNLVSCSSLPALDLSLWKDIGAPHHVQAFHSAPLHHGGLFDFFK